jgi:HD superfamily phosphohydrolase
MSKIFNDPIHGRIELPEYCINIIDTIEFQRLRYLKQLGLLNYVFYGATHTRFEHSIGVCWLAGEWIKHLARKQPELNITEKDIKIVQIAGLVHDIGHGPFSHTFERFIHKSFIEENKSNKSKECIFHHEKMSIDIFRQMKCCEADIEDSVCKIISGENLEKEYLGQIVNNKINGLDCDKLDYFIRDSQCTSFKIGCDVKRIIYESSVLDQEIVYPHKLVGDIFNLYQTRYRLYKELYYHKTVVIMEELFLEALLLADSKGVFKFTDSKGHKVSLYNSINDVNSFLQTQDDIIGQMERCEFPEIIDFIKIIKTRQFKHFPLKPDHSRFVTYGMASENPLMYVKFIDKNKQYIGIDSDVIKSMCPSRFMLEI